MPAAREIAALTSPGEKIALVGIDANPAYLFYAGRRGWSGVTVEEACREGYTVLQVTPGSATVTSVPCP
jgi:hypothetical protein